MPDIITDAEIEEGMKSREVSHQQMRSNMRKTKDRKGFNKGNYVLYQEQVGPNTSKWVRTLEVIEARPHEKSYFVKDLSSNTIYLRPKNHLKLKEGYQSLTTAEARMVKVISTEEELKGILKLSRTSKNRFKTISFCEEVTRDVKEALIYAKG